FWLGKYEVTQGQYASVMGTNPSRFREAGLQAPVECVDWGDAQAFLRRLNAQSLGGTYRLPTEAEWEYACRAGSIGSTYGPPGAIAWNAYTSGLRSHPVGEKQANAWGLCDMLGNVSELCEDCYKDPYDTSLDTDPVGPPSNRYHAIRGGSWQSGTTQTRAAHRSSEAEFELRYPMVGFRVACMPPAGKK
ncbi:MAG TPA: SUMF1/EgtB/PvdO family nonheme iron enzyme, partial [Holophaga sp.]|nr:SUMF1/EgtB/PvdO family nonheme iron enzyme [Holophaga sp.]